MYRLDKEYKYPEILTKPSHCENCNKQLKWYDLIPILSYIITNGKCSKCKQPITIYYPTSELVLGISFAMFYYTNQPWYYYLILVVLFSLTYFDYFYKAIPQTPTLIFLASGMVWILIQSLIQNTLILNATISGFVLMLCITLLLLVMYGKKFFSTKDGFEGFGLGDFLILFTLSMYISTKHFWVMFWFSILLAILYYLVSSIGRKMDMKKSLPLLPFITLGYIVVVLCGEYIFDLILPIWIL